MTEILANLLDALWAMKWHLGFVIGVLVIIGHHERSATRALRPYVRESASERHDRLDREAQTTVDAHRAKRGWAA